MNRGHIIWDNPLNSSGNAGIDRTVIGKAVVE